MEMEKDMGYVWALVRKILTMYRVTELNYAGTAGDDGSFAVSIQFADLRSAASWHSLATEVDAEPEAFGPPQFADVEIKTQVTRFDAPVRVSALLRAEWIDWALRVR